MGQLAFMHTSEKGVNGWTVATCNCIIGESTSTDKRYSEGSCGDNQ